LKITFLGGARTVTGSMHRLATNRTKVLLECGLFQGRREEAEQINRQVPPAAVEADFMLLSHSHIDHSGNIPNLVKSGFNHEIYMTPASRDLTELLLRDSAHIQEADLQFLNKKRAKAGLPPKEPIYTLDDAEQATKYLSSIAYGRRFERGDIAFAFHEAGHILGSAQIVIEAEGKKIVFTGDLGRKNLPIIRDPEFLAQADYLITESTYGGRVHPPFEEARDKLVEAIRRVTDRQGRIVVPAFALGRTQELVYALQQLTDAGKIPDIPVFVDSPLASHVTEVFRKHQECLDEEARRMLAAGQEFLWFKRLRFVASAAESIKLNDFQQPCIIISASGMAESGRVLHHLKHAVTDPRNMVLMVGFAAEHTLARRIIDRAPVIKIFGEEYPLRAEVEVIDAFSAHADKNGLLEHVRRFDRARLKKIFLVHGELDQSEALQNALVAEGYDATVPVKGQTVELA
jgi:metallo-beta-lactamase family protein